METVYLAGHITGLPFATAYGWRQEATERLTLLGYQTLSPMQGEEHREEQFGTQPLPYNYDGSRESFMKDSWMIRRADYVLVNLRQGELAGLPPSVGSMWEIGFAYALNKPIIVVTHEGSHPFVREPALVMRSLEEAYSWLGAMQAVGPGQIVKREWLKDPSWAGLFEDVEFSTPPSEAPAPAPEPPE